MMRWQLERRLIVAGFVAAAVVLVFVGYESYWETVRAAGAAEARGEIHNQRNLR